MKHSSSAHDSIAGGGGRTLLDHVILQPEVYIGSVEKRTQTLWVYERGAMVRRAITHVPGLYKVFDEILVNATDNKQLDPSMNILRVEIDVAECRISVYNNGEGIPVEFNREEGLYVPELIFSHLPTSSSNCGDTVVTGVKLANIFSTEFIVEIADGRRMLKYKQVCAGNMGKKSEPEITICNQGENWTRVTFKPDLAKFNMTHLEDDVVSLMRKRVIDLAGTLGATMNVELDGKIVPLKNFSNYVNWYIKSASRDRGQELPRIREKVNDQWEVCVSLSEGQFQQVSFVNGIATTRGGSHVDHVTNQIVTYVMKTLNMKMKKANMDVHNVKDHLWVFVNVLIENPAFDSHTKDTLTIHPQSFGSKCEFSDVFLKKVVNSGVIRNMLLERTGGRWTSMKKSCNTPYSRSVA